jgi:hypothetical protein
MTTVYRSYSPAFQIDEEENRASTARPSASDGHKSFPDKPIRVPGSNPAAGVRNPRHDSSLPVGSLRRLRPARVAAAVVLCTSTRAPGGAAYRAARQLDAAMTTRLRGRDSRPSHLSHRGPPCSQMCFSAPNLKIARSAGNKSNSIRNRPARIARPDIAQPQTTGTFSLLPGHWKLCASSSVSRRQYYRD